ncbi:MAG: sugar transferase [Actinomycetota bacterium]|nr:sugar transferase [Actinomycetota bacterium]
MSKRATDIILASVLIVVTLPLLLGACIVSAVSLRAWPFFAQQRVGLNGKPFLFFKVRTLPTSTPRYVLKDELQMSAVPRACKALRRLKLDELPQLLLVVTGKMSLVGPRPEMVEFQDRLEPSFARARTSIRPGCTGLWQVGAACQQLIGESPEYDLYYIDHHELALDIWVLIRTARMMLGHGELVELQDMPGQPGVPPLPSSRLDRRDRRAPLLAQLQQQEAERQRRESSRPRRQRPLVASPE